MPWAGCRVLVTGHTGFKGAWLLDSTRARTELGWSPRWDLRAGLAATIARYEAHRRGADARTLVYEQLDAHAAA